MANEKNLILYRSPEWALVLEIYIALQAFIVGLVGSLRVGALAAGLRFIDEGFLWSIFFCGLGAGLFITALFELRCRAAGKDCACMRRFAIARELFNVGLVPCWLFAVMVLFLSGYTLVLVPAIAAQALVFIVIVQLENVRAQRVKAADRRSPAVADVGHYHGLSR